MANRTYEYNPINDSPVIVATAGEVLKTAGFINKRWSKNS